MMNGCILFSLIVALFLSVNAQPTRRDAFTQIPQKEMSNFDEIAELEQNLKNHINNVDDSTKAYNLKFSTQDRLVGTKHWRIDVENIVEKKIREIIINKKSGKSAIVWDGMTMTGTCVIKDRKKREYRY